MVLKKNVAGHTAQHEALGLISSTPKCKIKYLINFILSINILKYKFVNGEHLPT
jgi:hypothetical protein